MNHASFVGGPYAGLDCCDFRFLFADSSRHSAIPADPSFWTASTPPRQRVQSGNADVIGGYLERLSSFAVASGMMDHAEIGSLAGRAARDGLGLEIVGPLDVSHVEVNRQINRAPVGVVCGEDDGAPAILAEYQLVGLPVLANARLSCGLQIVTPETRTVAPEDANFAEGLDKLLCDYARYDTRDVALVLWAWQPVQGKMLNEILNARMVP